MEDASNVAQSIQDATPPIFLPQIVFMALAGIIILWTIADPGTIQSVISQLWPSGRLHLLLFTAIAIGISDGWLRWFQCSTVEIVSDVGSV
jgi:hypothetical protein